MNSEAQAGLWLHRTAFRGRCSDLLQISQTLPLQRGRCQQRPTQLKEIDQRAGDVQSLGVFGDAAVAHLGEAKIRLEYQEGMLALWRARSTCCGSSLSTSSTCPW